MHSIKIGVPYLFDRPIPIYWNSYLAGRLGGIKQKKSSWGSMTNNTFLLFYSPNPRSQLWILIYRKWSIRRRPLLNAADGIACVAWRFWLGALSNKGTRETTRRFFSQLCRSFSRASRANFAASPLVRPARQNRHATQAADGSKISSKHNTQLLECGVYLRILWEKKN